MQREQLPSHQTAVNVADEEHVLAGFQATEKMLDAQNVTLHMDGTSRSGEKFVGHQITLDSGETLSLGFTLLATEYAATLLDITVQLLEEITDIFSSDSSEREAVFSSLLSKLTSTMTDRAAVMKSFDVKLKSFIESKLGQEATMLFLHCNAHFLLGLSRACDIAVKSVEKEDGKLGRDKLPKFSSVRKAENSASRVIRTAADILGPRGDDRNGCRAEWLGHCEETNRRSQVTSYRSNRFNCYFQGAAAIIHHLDDMKAFFSKGFLSHSNMKIEGVAADIEDLSLMVVVCAIAVLFIHVTGPYWELVQSATKHSEFHKYAQKMERYFEKWREDASDLVKEDFSGVFDGEFQTASPTKHAVCQFAAQHPTEVKDILQRMMPGMLQTTRAQLKEYLSDGMYGQPLSPADTNLLQHCPLTNLLGENVFGELDFDMGKRRHASLHHRSSIQMLQHNKIPQWLEGKEEKKRSDLMSLARVKAKPIRQLHRRQEQIVKMKIRQKLLENERSKRLKEAADAKKRADIIKK